MGTKQQCNQGIFLRVFEKERETAQCLPPLRKKREEYPVVLK